MALWFPCPASNAGCVSGEAEQLIGSAHALMGALLSWRRRVAWLLGVSPPRRDFVSLTFESSCEGGPGAPANAVGPAIVPAPRSRRRGGARVEPVAVLGLRDVADQAVLRAAFAEAGARGAVLEVVHAWETAPPDPTALPARRGWGASMTSVHRDVFAAVAGAAAEYPGARYAVMVIQGDPTTVLVERSRRAGLLMIGRVRAASGPDGPGTSRGGTGRELLARARCPVLVLDPRLAAGGPAGAEARAAGQAGAAGRAPAGDPTEDAGGGETGTLAMLAM